MRISIGVVAQLSVLIATLVVHQFNSLPQALLFGLTGTWVCSALLLLFANRSAAAPGWFALCLWSIFFASLQASIVTFRAQDRLAAVVPEAIEGVNFRLVGVIDSLPSLFERGASFEFFVEKCEADNPSKSEPSWCPKGRLVKLSWFNGAPSRLLPGQRWDFTTRLRRPHARLNPYLFDAELRMFEQGIVAQGSVRVREQTPARLIGDAANGFGGLPWWVERARHHLRDSIKTALDSKEFLTLNIGKQSAQDIAKLSLAVTGVLIALVVGDQGAIAASWWTVFNQTGVGHLMSISGLHVTMMAGFVASFSVACWKLYLLLIAKLRWVNAAKRIPSKQWVRWSAAIAGAWAYTALAGFGIPAQRTCWMVTLAALAVLGGRTGSAISVILFTAFAITVIDPWAILSAGFWLSFGAVSAIIYFGSARHFSDQSLDTKPADSSLANTNVRISIKRWLRQTLSNGWQSQVAATLSLLPIGAAFFSSFALLSPIANAIAIPLVSALVTPLAIAGGMLSFAGATLIGDSLLWFGATLTAPLLQWLGWLAGLPRSVAVLGKPEFSTLLLGTGAMLWLLAPYRVVPLKLRFCGLLALLPVVLQTPQVPTQGEAKLTIFDVGQGSAVLIETTNRRLLFDLGPSYGTDSDAGSAVISPYLRARGFKAVDALILSHYDLDHLGGLHSLLSSMPVGWLASSVRQSDDVWHGANTPFYRCQRGDTWEWDGVKFEFLYPEVNGIKGEIKDKKSNANSCVLKVSAGGVSALLTADIEAGDERRILRKLRSQDLRTDVLFAPNHGSKTSSSASFIEAVSPTIAVFQLGFRNRFKYPDLNVLQRYEKQNIAIYRTDELGAFGITLPTLNMSAQRSAASPYWRTRLGRSLRNEDSYED
jgi:competence protein ComEC